VSVVTYKDDMNLNARTHIATILLAVAAALSSAHPAGANERIAVLVSMDARPFQDAVAGFQEHLAKQGVRADYEQFSLRGDSANAAAAMHKIKQGRFDLIYTLGSPATEAAVDAAKDVPIIAGIILKQETLANMPNVTGVGLEFPLETQFRLMQRILPQTGTVGVIYNPRENRKKVEAASRVALQFGLHLEAQEVSTPQDIPAALERISRRADVLWGLADSLVLSAQLAKPVLLFSFRNSIPFVGPSATWVKAGALYSLDHDYHEIGSQCAEMAIKVMRGSRAGDVPPEAPRTVKYSLNLNTARQMKIPLDDELVRGALHTY